MAPGPIGGAAQKLLADSSEGASVMTLGGGQTLQSGSFLNPTGKVGYAAARACTTMTRYVSAVGWRGNPRHFENTLDMLFKYDCNGLKSVEFVGATQTTKLPGVTRAGIKAKTAIRNGERGRVKAQYVYKLGVGWFASEVSQCLGVNVRSNKIATSWTVDHDCRATPDAQVGAPGRREIIGNAASLAFPIIIALLFPHYAWFILMGGAIIAQWTVARSVRRAVTVIYLVCILGSFAGFMYASELM